MLFSNASALVDTARERPLREGDLPPLPASILHAMDCSCACPNDRGAGAFLRHLVWNFRHGMLGCLGLNGLRFAMALVSPLLLYRLVAAVSRGPAGGLNPALLTAVGLSLASIGFALATQHYLYRTLTLGMQLRASLSTGLYQHVLRLPRWHKVARKNGDLMNLLATDVAAVSELPGTLSELLYSVGIVVGVGFLLGQFLGLAAVVPFVILLALAPLSRWMGRRFARLQTSLMSARDSRVSMIAQALSGIRVVKYFGLDRKVHAEIQERRRCELGWLTRLVRARSVSELVYYLSNPLLALGSFAAFLLLGGKLDAATVFACLALFGRLKEPFGQLTTLVGSLAKAKVSAGRLAEAFRLVRVPESEPAAEAGVAAGIVLEDVTLRHAGGDEPVLRNVSLTVQPREAVAIVGPVGCGKSTLLLALLGEIPQVEGKVDFTGISGLPPRLAYVPQEAFLLNATLRENLTLGASDVDPEPAIRAACLARDVALLPQGLDTEIGEAGVNLSGGQKQRVSLARAVLHRPGVVLLDDPLSAVDFTTEKSLVDELLFGEWRNATRVVVTHRLAHLNRFDRVVFMEGGRIAAVGTHESLLQEHARYREFVSQSSEAPPDEPLVTMPECARPEAAGHLTEAEMRGAGKIAFGHFWNYFLAMGGDRIRYALPTLAGLVLVIFVAILLQLAQDSWLAIWTSGPGASSSASTHAAVGGLVAVARSVGLEEWLTAVLRSDFAALGVYAALALLFIMSMFVRFISWGRGAVSAARHFHDIALMGVVSAPLRLFDSNPTGRILNRFSTDIARLENEVAWGFEATIASVLRLLVALAIMVWVLPPVALVVMLLSVAFFGLQKRYRASSRDAQRLSSLSNSPLFSHFQETLAGLTVIRAMDKGDLFSQRFRSVLEKSLAAQYGLLLLNRWFTVRMPLLSGFLTVIVALGVAWLAGSGDIAPGVAGLVLTYSLNFWGSLIWSIRAFSILETSMVSVERMREYGTLEPEPSVTLTPALPPDTPWPSRGEVEFADVVVRYAPHLPDVLRGVSFRAPAGARVGIIGRTGSGKSTLFQTLFRFVPTRVGRVLIDGIDIASVPLERLRQSVAIIPQSPTLFAGTLRSNLDRFAQHDDAALWNALDKVYLRSFVAGLPGGLDAEVRENGENFSVGQRQLLCLARALLVGARVLVMDEATANVDVETDALIQRTIRTAFEGVTVLIIAHRLETVADCHAIVELQEGRVAAC